MKTILSFLVITTLLLCSCKSDIKTTTENTANKEKTIKTNDEGPTFRMIDKSKSSIKIIDADTIDVNSIEEIVAKADHNKALRLKKGIYNLDDKLVYYISGDKKEIINKAKIESRSIGGQIYISGMTNFSIIGEGSKILSNNPKATPLFILNSEQGIIKGLTLGHNIPKNTTSNVPSLYVARSNKVNFYNCELGNNSRMGLKIQNSKYLTFTDCNIRNAREKIIEVIQGKTISYVNSTFDNNVCTRGCFDFLGNENSVEFKSVIVQNNKSETKQSTHLKQIITGPSENIRFRKSKFRKNIDFERIGLDEFNLTDCEVQSF